MQEEADLVKISLLAAELQSELDKCDDEELEFLVCSGTILDSHRKLIQWMRDHQNH